MHKYVLLAIMLIAGSVSALYGQITYSPTVRSKNNNCTIEKVQLTEEETIVTIKVPRSKSKRAWVRFSSATVLVPSEAWSISDARRSQLDYPNFAPPAGTEQLYANTIRRIKEGRQQLSDAGFLIRSLGARRLDTEYKLNEEGRDFYYFELHFDRLPYGCEDVYIREIVAGGWEWVGVRVNNPFPTIPNIGLNEFEIKQKIDNQNDGIVGIYEGFSDNKYKLACIKDSNEYKLIYLGGGRGVKAMAFG